MDGDWLEFVSVLNDAVKKVNAETKQAFNNFGGSRPIKDFEVLEVLTCFGILIGAADCSQSGNQLLEPPNHNNTNNNWISIAPTANFTSRILRLKNI